MNIKRIFWTVAILLSSIAISSLRAQTPSSSLEFLQYNPDTRSAGMGNTYLCSGNGMYLYGDPAAFGMSGDYLFVSYSLSVLPKSEQGRQIFNAFSAGYKIFPKWSVMAGFRSQTGWSIPLIDHTGMVTGEVRPDNWSVDLGSTLGFSKKWVGYFRGSYVHSYQGLNASSVALSLGANFTNKISVANIPFEYSFSAGLTNFGWDLKYGNERKEVGLPSAAELGGNINMLLCGDHKISVAGILGCELRQNVTYRLFGGVGLEYEFAKYASLRAGYHNRHNINTYSIGLGSHYKFASIDLAYLMTKRTEFNQFRLGLNVRF